MSSNASVQSSALRLHVQTVHSLPFRPRALHRWVLKHHGNLSSLTHSSHGNRVYLQLGEGEPPNPHSCAQKSNLVVILYLSFAVFIRKNIHKWKIVYGKINKWWIQTSASIWWLMSQMSHFPSCFYQTFALGQLPFLNFLLLCLHITDPNLPAVCQLQSMFISRNYMTSDLQPQEVHGCAHLNVGGASPEVHVIKLHSSGSGLCGWEQATTWCPGKSRN